MKNFRPKKLIKYTTLWLTEEGYIILRKQKKKEKKSMMQIVEDALTEKYASEPLNKSNP